MGKSCGRRQSGQTPSAASRGRWAPAGCMNIISFLTRHMDTRPRGHPSPFASKADAAATTTSFLLVLVSPIKGAIPKAVTRRLASRHFLYLTSSRSLVGLVGVQALPRPSPPSQCHRGHLTNSLHESVSSLAHVCAWPEMGHATRLGIPLHPPPYPVPPV